MPGISKEFAQECKEVAEKYSPYTKHEIDKIVEDTGVKRLMKVYIIKYKSRWETDEELVAVAASKPAAEKYIKNFVAKYPDAYEEKRFMLEEHELVEE